VSDDLAKLMRETAIPLARARADRVAALGEALSAVLDTFRAWLHFPDAELLYLNIAALLANRMEEGDPVWLVNVGGSSRGKTEMLSAFVGVGDVRVVGSLTEAALLSGTPKKERGKTASGGLLRELPEFGATLVIKDFGAILTLPRDRRAIVDQALRDVYDGRYVRDVGTSGGQKLEWTGRLGLLAGATGALDGHHGVVGALGERWLTLRLPTDSRDGLWDDEDEMARRALAGGQTKSMRPELSEAVCGYVGSLEPPPWRQLDDADTELVVAVSVLVTTARSPVERDPYGSRAIEFVPQGEGPGRFARQLHKLTLCLYALGLNRAHVHAAIRRLALDSIPPTRRRALEYLLGREEPEKTGAVAARCSTSGGCSRRATRPASALRRGSSLRRRLARSRPVALRCRLGSAHDRDIDGAGLADRCECGNLRVRADLEWGRGCRPEADATGRIQMGCH
jgi:hypothetical protein